MLVLSSVICVVLCCIVLCSAVLVCYGPGDIANVFPCNDQLLVQRALKLISLENELESSTEQQQHSKSPSIPVTQETFISIRFREPLAHHRPSLVGDLDCSIGKL